jgi:hypothetical protein
VATRTRSRSAASLGPSAWPPVLHPNGYSVVGFGEAGGRVGSHLGPSGWLIGARTALLTELARHTGVLAHWFPAGRRQGTAPAASAGLAWSSPQMLRRYGASARSARARRTYDRIMQDRP